MGSIYYSTLFSRINQIEHTFGILKTKISKRNFNAKCFEKIIKEEIVKLIW